jgi:hypothetical protein
MRPSPGRRAALRRVGAGAIDRSDSLIPARFLISADADAIVETIAMRPENPTRRRTLPVSDVEDPMSLMVQAISSHPVLIRAVEEILGDAKEYLYLPTVSNEDDAIRLTNQARLFLLDACSLRADVGLTAQRCRASSPGSKFISLQAPAASNDADTMRLLHVQTAPLREAS